MLTDAELVLGLSRHLSAYASSPAKAALEQVEFCGQVYDVAFRLRRSGTSTPARVAAIGTEAGLGPRSLRDVIGTLEQLRWVSVQRNAKREPLSVAETVPDPADLVDACATVLSIVTISAVERAALVVLRATTIQPLLVGDAIASRGGCRRWCGCRGRPAGGRGRSTAPDVNRSGASRNRGRRTRGGVQSQRLDERRRHRFCGPPRGGRSGHVRGHCAAGGGGSFSRLARGTRAGHRTALGGLRNDGLLAEPYSLLGALEALGRAVQRQGVLPHPTGPILAGHSLIALLLAALQDAGHLGMIPPELLRRRLELALTVGHPDDDYVLQVLERADDLVEHHVERVHRAYSDAGAARRDVNGLRLRELVGTPPPFVGAYLDFVERLRANPVVARSLLQTAELACFHALLGAEAWSAPAFDSLFTPEHRGLLVAGVRTLASVSGEAVAGQLSGIAELRFDRSASAVPDRQQPPMPAAQLPLS